jgi:GTP pyrophosphokinase
VKSQSGIVVNGIHDLAVRFSRCCSPVPGDEIVGYVTRGRGITIHRTDCVNVMNLPEIERSRLIDAEWQEDIAEQKEAAYSAELAVFANNRTGVLMDVTRVFTERQIDIKSVNARINKQGDRTTIVVSFDTHGVSELNYLMSKLRQVEGVLNIERTTG